MKIYTRTGDQGHTRLPGGAEVSKDAALVEFCGGVDELNSALGIARASALPEDIDRLLERTQHELFNLGAEVAHPQPPPGMPVIRAEYVRAMEEAIDAYTAELAPLANFILPGGTPAAAALHFARSVCRRGERSLAMLARETQKPVSAAIMAYLNRLSDLLFVLARVANARAGRADTLWRKDR